MKLKNEVHEVRAVVGDVALFGERGEKVFGGFGGFAEVQQNRKSQKALYVTLSPPLPPPLVVA